VVFMAEPTADPFPWPDGKRAAVSLSFDDARLSQADVGVGILDAAGIKATFYVGLDALARRLPVWRDAVRSGHEIGNHTLTHPCSGNFTWARGNPLEAYTLPRIEAELVDANAVIAARLGVRPTTFAYPCGEMAVGTGARVESYVPVVARLFDVGRGFRDEWANHPRHCDLARIFAIQLDGLSFPAAKTWVDLTLADGGWLVFAGHEIGASGPQSVHRAVLGQLCTYLGGRRHDIWVDTVAAVGRHIADARNARSRL
jgi:hypothetical protein